MHKAAPPDELTEAIRAVAGGNSYIDRRLDSRPLARSTTSQVRELSPRELEILDLLAQGLTGTQAAQRLYISPETVRTHIRNAMTKLQARIRVHAIALQQREIDFDEFAPSPVSLDAADS